MTRVTVVGAARPRRSRRPPRPGSSSRPPRPALLVDCGQGVIRGLMPLRDPRELDAIIVGHLHADHYIDLVSLRYLMPWDGFTGRRMPVLLPPGGRRKLDELATAISERPGFFDDTFEVVEYDPAQRLEIGDLYDRVPRRQPLRPGLGLRDPRPGRRVHRRLRRHRSERRARRGLPRRRPVRRRGDAPDARPRTIRRAAT